ncbi:MAG TPA: murein L,D-transpeptidase catalytic domain family protein [Ignavibacteriaceae bacterium]|nr:murein L,D-transpeptidase catalytic domain family protein [Ignavibacteriaceae bacterium]
MKVFLLAFIGVFSLLSNSISNSAPGEKKINSGSDIISDEDYNQLLITSLYTDCELTGKLDYNVFKQAMDGYSSIDLANNKLLSIIDYSKPSSEKRFFIIDIENHKLLYHTLVAHGKRSGYVNATKFSNKIGSYKSSLGFFRTGNSYFGIRGYSLKLEGLERGINDNARQRGIIIHGANYVDERIANGNGVIGRSHGCPAVSKKLSKEIINLLKGGSLLFIYANDELYKENSVIANLNVNENINLN